MCTLTWRQRNCVTKPDEILRWRVYVTKPDETWRQRGCVTKNQTNNSHSITLKRPRLEQIDFQAYQDTDYKWKCKWWQTREVSTHRTSELFWELCIPFKSFSDGGDDAQNFFAWSLKFGEGCRKIPVRKEDMNTEQLMGWLSFEAQIPPWTMEWSYEFAQAEGPEGTLIGTFWNSFLNCPQAALASNPRVCRTLAVTLLAAKVSTNSNICQTINVSSSHHQ